uniref:Uncharacterized protein n=2 Tax=Knipowitschia caucasica TaxID=637954 RepID=A0AAV2J479_KNICA
MEKIQLLRDQLSAALWQLERDLLIDVCGRLKCYGLSSGELIKMAEDVFDEVEKKDKDDEKTPTATPATAKRKSRPPRREQQPPESGDTSDDNDCCGTYQWHLRPGPGRWQQQQAPLNPLAVSFQPHQDPAQPEEDLPLQSEEYLPLQSEEDLPLQSEEYLPLQSEEDLPLQSEEDLPLQSKENVPVQSLDWPGRGESPTDNAAVSGEVGSSCQSAETHRTRMGPKKVPKPAEPEITPDSDSEGGGAAGGEPAKAETLMGADSETLVCMLRKCLTFQSDLSKRWNEETQKQEERWQEMEVQVHRLREGLTEVARRGPQHPHVHQQEEVEPQSPTLRGEAGPSQ